MSFRIFRLLLFVAFFVESTSLAVIVGDGYEVLSPEEKMALEQETHSSPPQKSLCSQTEEFARKFQPVPRHLLSHTDLMLMDKKRRLLHILSNGEVLGSYIVALGGNPLGHKSKEGDQKTPEGLYFFDLKNRKSEYYLSLRINYPNPQDRANALRDKIKNPGENIMLHGLPNSWLKRQLIRHPRDWTKGCMAVTNSEIEELFENIKLGTKIEICP